MKTIFTKSTINWGCYDNRGQKKQDTIWFIEDLTITDILDANISLKDKSWFIRHNCDLTDKQFREFVIGCALVILPIYENKYPNSNAPRKAIEAAQAYLANTINLEELKVAKQNAAAAADAAAYAAYAAAYAADAAAYAAYAAAYAAYAAAYAAYAAAYAAYAAYVADAAVDAVNAVDASTKVDYKEVLLNFFKEFTKS